MKPPADWPEDLRLDFEERAALIADGCKVTREESERMALEQLRAKLPLKQSSLFERVKERAGAG